MRVALTQAMVQGELRREVLAAIPADLLRRGQQYLSESKQLGFSIISYASSEYPAQLRVIDLPPLASACFQLKTPQMRSAFPGPAA